MGHPSGWFSWIRSYISKSYVFIWSNYSPGIRAGGHWEGHPTPPFCTGRMVRTTCNLFVCFGGSLRSRILRESCIRSRAFENSPLQQFQAVHQDVHQEALSWLTLGIDSLHLQHWKKHRSTSARAFLLRSVLACHPWQWRGRRLPEEADTFQRLLENRQNTEAAQRMRNEAALRGVTSPKRRMVQAPTMWFEIAITSYNCF